MAADGHEAISQVSFVHPDLVVLDIMLPDSDGFEVLKKLREHEPGLPVLFLTAKDDLQDKVGGLSVGGDDYVTKPSPWKRLLLASARSSAARMTSGK